MKKLLGSVLACIPLTQAVAADAPIIIGSKNFTESYLLAEMMAQLLETRGVPVQRQFGFGGTKVSFEALVTGEIDAYPEYSGTIAQVILDGDSDMSTADIRAGLETMGLEILAPLGFNNTYAVAVAADVAEARQLEKISDLSLHPDLRGGFSHEFRNRQDGWPGLVESYGLNLNTSGIEHGLAYQAIAERKIDLTDAYSTDGELTRYNLVLLDDNKNYFPSYLAVPLVRRQLDLSAKIILNSMAGRLTDARMRELNAAVVIDKLPIAAVAARFLQSEGLSDKRSSTDDGMWTQLRRNTLRHLQLTIIALVMACLAGTGLSLAVYRSGRAAGLVLYLAGLIQTVPSIALLALMIPLLGVGMLPAIVALFLYSLLPILRNAITALTTIDPVYRRVAEAMGLTRRQQLRYVLMPLAYPHILAGIRTAAVISIGTATLAAFIGAGGLGEPIVTGLALNNTSLILQGAIPAALLAVATEIAFSGLERQMIPRHIRQSQ
ncbi:MAG: glycine betaine ABC transporter substrate-binding protein [Gammaproteobacteria bacterium]